MASILDTISNLAVLGVVVVGGIALLRTLDVVEGIGDPLKSTREAFARGVSQTTGPIRVGTDATGVRSTTAERIFGPSGQISQDDPGVFGGGSSTRDATDVKRQAFLKGNLLSGDFFRGPI